MTVEIGDVTLKLLTQVSVRERARIVHHSVPGMQGDLAQTLGRPSVWVSLEGIFYGESAEADLQRLRDAYLAQEPVDFFTEAIGEGYFTQVLISRLDVSQRADALNQFDYTCEVVEYVEPPQPLAASPLAAVDVELAGEAAGFMDSAQESLATVTELTSMMNLPDFGDPTQSLATLLDDYVGAANESQTVLQQLRDLF